MNRPRTSRERGRIALGARRQRIFAYRRRPRHRGRRQGSCHRGRHLRRFQRRQHRYQERPRRIRNFRPDFRPPYRRTYLMPYGRLHEIREIARPAPYLTRRSEDPRPLEVFRQRFHRRIRLRIPRRLQGEGHCDFPRAPVRRHEALSGDSGIGSLPNHGQARLRA